MPRFDIGNSDNASNINFDIPNPIAQRFKIAWSDDGKQKTMILLTKAVIDAGRQTSQDICLRIEPTEEPENHEKSKQISSHHFSLRYIGNGIQFVNTGRNGSTVDKKKVEPNIPVMIDRKTIISVADVLDLEMEPIQRIDGHEVADDLYKSAIAHATDSALLQERFLGAEKPGMVNFLRINRKNNLPDLQYVILFHSGWIGSGDDSLLRVPVSELTPRRRRSFDVGEQIATDPARLLIHEGAIWIERTGGDDVFIGSKSIKLGKKHLLELGEIIVGKMVFSVSVE